MEREAIIRERIAYWEERSTAAVRAAEYANRQFKLAVEELASLGNMALGLPPVLTLINCEEFEDVSARTL